MKFAEECDPSWVRPIVIRSVPRAAIARRMYRMRWRAAMIETTRVMQRLDARWTACARKERP